MIEIAFFVVGAALRKNVQNRIPNDGLIQLSASDS
jgi:hypothetical protein